MSLTLLLDLDDTLLDTNLKAFMPAYFQALSKQLASYVAPAAMLQSLLTGMNRMYASEDPRQTLQEIFERDFYARLGVLKEDLAESLEEFYDEIFPTLAQHTKPRPDAVPLIEWALSGGYRVAIATDPLFPYKATFHRLRWAGFDPTRFEIVSTFEHFHFSKTHPAYYAEVLGQLGWPDGPILVVGNDVERDLLPAHRLGLKTYLIDAGSNHGVSAALATAIGHGGAALGPYPQASTTSVGVAGTQAPGSEDPAAAEFVSGRGQLAELRAWIESTDLSSLEPSFKSREAILAIMAATPAVLHSLARSLTEEEWRCGPTSEDWAMSEIVCHLRDTEREVNQMQINLMLEKPGSFIPRPNTAVWASERDYLHVDGTLALAEFAAARIRSLDTLKRQEPEMWSRKARHAIFGPTDFLEVTNFFADHDRLHIQQAWKILKSL